MNLFRFLPVGLTLVWLVCSSQYSAKISSLCFWIPCKLNMTLNIVKEELIVVFDVDLLYNALWLARLGGRNT
jgi:hypothetical protein